MSDLSEDTTTGPFPRPTNTFTKTHSFHHLLQEGCLGLIPGFPESWLLPLTKVKVPSCSIRGRHQSSLLPCRRKWFFTLYRRCPRRTLLIASLCFDYVVTRIVLILTAPFESTTICMDTSISSKGSEVFPEFEVS